ncbi:hypothetical protein [Roseateles sp. LYH14W]|uniref:Uncharacterized protein n=1 Tax=Pelomonas parva TaxID=3299032 RepID=A0ABW7F7G0_9BURK
MLTSTFTEALQRFLGTRQTYAPLTSFVTDLSQRYERVLSPISKLPEDSSKWQSINSEMHQVMAEAGTALRGNPSSAIFKAAEHLEEAVSLVPLPAPVEKVEESLTAFKHSLDTFLEGQNAQAGFNLLLAAHTLGRRYDALVEIAESVSQALEPEPLAEGGRLVIAIDDDLSLEEMAAFLTFFATLYRRLAEIAELQGGDRQLRARRIESGSWWMDLAGNPTVIGLLGTLVTAFFAWSYRRYTNEGRSKTLPEKMESVQKALGLREKLKDAGFKVEHLDATIQELEHEVARELVDLFDSRRRVRVDNAVYTRIEPVWPELGTVSRTLISAPPKSLFLPSSGGNDDKG